MSFLSGSTIDEATVELILQLQLEDIEDTKRTSKGKGREDDRFSDAEIALQLQQEEFERAFTESGDRRMAESIRRAVLDDGAHIAVLAGEEIRAAGDRQMACLLSGQTPQPNPQAPILDTDDELLSKLSSFNIEDADEDDCHEPSSAAGEAGESSAWGAARRPQKVDVPRSQCDSCTDMKHTVQMPCKHRYCRQCTVRLFTEALPDESLFPVRCCRQLIPMSVVHHYLGSDLARRVDKKAIEYSTSNRTYCHEASCATFIEPGYTLGPTGTCPIQRCGRQTCILCKKAAHSGDCPPQDDGLVETLLLAQANGWQRCVQCQNFVELHYGCNHIT